MKHTLFKCEITDAAIDAYDEHMKHNPNGLGIHRGRSASKVYYGYVIYETKTQIVIKEL